MIVNKIVPIMAIFLEQWHYTLVLNNTIQLFLQVMLQICASEWSFKIKKKTIIDIKLKRFWKTYNTEHIGTKS